MRNEYRKTGIFLTKKTDKNFCTRLSVLVSFFIMTTYSTAQTELEYKMEIGGMAGTSTYIGDANYTGFYKNINMGGGVIARYNLNPRAALKFNVGYGGISGDVSNVAYPDEIDRENLKFSKSLFDFGCQYEMNFWAYGTGNSYKNTHRLVPYIQLGLGFTAASGTFSINIPVGFGIKYKIAPRVNVGLDWTVRLSMTDKIDGIEDPYRIKSGFMKNKDSYCWTMVYVSYDFMPKLRKCNN